MMQTQFINQETSENEKNNKTKGILFLIAFLLASFLFLFMPNRIACGKLIFYTNVVEKITFDTEVWNAPRQNKYVRVAYLKMINDTIIYHSYEPSKIIDFGVENIIGKKVRYAVRERENTGIFGLAVNKVLVFSDSNTKGYFWWWVFLGI